MAMKKKAAKKAGKKPKKITKKIKAKTKKIRTVKKVRKPVSVRTPVVFKRPESRSVQKSVRIPRTILSYISQQTEGTGVTLPRAVVQVLETWHQNGGRVVVPVRPATTLNEAINQ